MRWSTIGKIGNTSLAKLTILIPLLGTFIIYNSYISELISPALRINVYPENEKINEGIYFLIQWVHNRSIEFLYFGLLLMGLSTFFYQLLSPSQVKEGRSAMEYAIKREQASSRVAVELELIEIFRDIKSDRTAKGLQSELFAISLFNNIDFTTPQTKTILPKIGRELSDENGVSAKLISKEASENNSRFLCVLADEAMKRQVDLYYCNYNNKDLAKDITKIPIIIVMAGALLLLLSPTLATALIILRGNTNVG